MLLVLRWLSGWPLWLLHALGAPVGWLGWALSGRYRRRLEDNATLAGVGPGERREAIVQAGRMVMEMPWIWLRPPDAPVLPWVRWEGDALLEELVSAPGPLLLLTPHMGSFEISARAYAERFGARKPLTVLYRPPKQAALRQIEQTVRSRPHLHTAPATLAGVRQMLRALRRGEAVGLLPDQVPPAGMGVWAPFFGRPAYTMSLVSRFVALTGARVLMVWAERLPRGRGFVMHIGADEVRLPSSPFEDDDAEVERATAVNRALEAVIERAPGQYLWSYNRYKEPRLADRLGTGA